MSAGAISKDIMKPNAASRKTSDSSIASGDFGFGADFETALASPSVGTKIPEGPPPPEPSAGASDAAAPATPSASPGVPRTPAAHALTPAATHTDDAANAFLKAKARSQGHHNQAVASPSAGLDFAAYGAGDAPDKKIIYKSLRFKKSKWRKKLDEADFDGTNAAASVEPTAPPGDAKSRRQGKGSESWFSSLRRKKPGTGGTSAGADL